MSGEMKFDVPDALVTVGVVLIVVALGFVYSPLALVALSAAVIVAGVAFGDPKKPRGG